MDADRITCCDHCQQPLIEIELLRRTVDWLRQLQQMGQAGR